MAKKKTGKKTTAYARAPSSDASGVSKSQVRHARPPDDLTWELIEELCATVGAGNFRYVAVQRAGVHLERFNRWISSGKRDLKLHTKGKLTGDLNMYCHLVLALEQAEGDAHGSILEDVLTNGDPSTKLRFLQLRYHKLYNKNPNSRIDDEDGSIQKVSAKEVLLDMLGAFLNSDDLPSDP
jgi:hypothetical protein